MACRGQSVAASAGRRLSEGLGLIFERVEVEFIQLVACVVLVRFNDQLPDQKPELIESLCSIEGNPIDVVMTAMVVCNSEVSAVIVRVDKFCEPWQESGIKVVLLYQALEYLARRRNARRRGRIVLAQQLRDAQPDSADNKYTTLLEVLDIASFSNICSKATPVPMGLPQRIQLQICVRTVCRDVVVVRH